MNEDLEYAILLKLLVDHVEDFAIFLLDADGTVATWNAGAERVFGYTSTEIVGQHFSKFYLREEVASHIPEKELERARTEGRASDDRWLLRKDGRHIWVSGVTVCFKSGGSCDFGKIIRDQTRMKQRDEAIQRLNKELQGTVERLERSEAMLTGKVQDMEGFEDAVVGRELQMIRIKKENERLRLELQQLKDEKRKD
jgi:PAS domain S-box-containing protein